MNSSSIRSIRNSALPLRRSLIGVLCGLTTVAAFAGDMVVGDASNTNITVVSDQNWTTIRSAVVTIPANSTGHNCMAVASADIDHPAGSAENVENRYRMVVTRNDPSPDTNTAWERVVSLIDNAGDNDPQSATMSTVRSFPNVTSTNGTNGGGNHTFYLLVRKYDAASENTDVEDASLAVMCVDP